ncbi:MAG TPA: respiratory nitrate reductase subunit gamma [Anaerolineae bacterium]|nr:respiratory nitrate reductase subunit gamma [Anaerolineae bacterium]
MDVVEYILAYITPYIAVIVLISGVAYQMYRWSQRQPVPAHLSLFPRPESHIGRLGDTLLDMFTMKGLLRVNRLLWAGGFIMHVGLLLLILGHIRVVTDFYFLWDWLRWGEKELHTFSLVAGLLAGFLFMIPLFYLLSRRFSGSVKWLSTPEDYFVLVLLVAIAITGMHMRMVIEVDQHAMREFMQGLYKFSWKPVPESAGISFIWHFALVQLLMIYFPFGKLLHTIGSVFNKMVMRS